MTDKQLRTLNLLKEFVQIANENNLDYLIFYGSLLGTIRHNGFIPWDDDVDLVISKETFDFLKQNYLHKLKINENSNNFLLIPKFSNDEDTNEEAVFLDLFVGVPTTNKRIKKYLSIKNKVRYIHSFSHRRTFKCQWGIRALKPLLCWSWLSKRYLFNDAYNDLFDKDGNLFAIINWPFKKVTYNNIFDNIDFKNYTMHQFEDIQVRVPSNWEEIFLKNYGPNWKTPIKYKMSEHLGMYDMNVYTTKKKNKE
ncbi:diacylglycerol cholinephosphotransferase Mf1 [Mycoplasmopsis hyopharyngis]|uniref:diacylglycerol cholinephosphotransferase Mf1 n=1 Tax=Mycoplasmopsis hyopharyngis TaxID=29558 RepID=UPI0038734242